MTTKIKRKMVNVKPISIQAKNRFVNEMDNLHGCYVEKETDEQMFLASINKKYLFSIDKVNDSHWKIVK
jgi:hypothetical protein